MASGRDYAGAKFGFPLEYGGPGRIEASELWSARALPLAAAFVKSRQDGQESWHSRNLFQPPGMSTGYDRGEPLCNGSVSQQAGFYK